MAQMTFDGQFSDLQLKVLAEGALEAIYPELVNIQDFAHNFTELESNYGAAVVIPVVDLSAAASFDESTNNYASGTQEIGAANVLLDSHFVKSVSITDREIGDTGVQFLRDAGAGIASVLGRAINKKVFDMMNATNFALSATFDVGTKAAPTAHKLFKIAAENGLDVKDSVVVLDPENFADLLGILDAYVYNGDQAVKYGYIPGLYGFKSVVSSTYLPEGVNGMILNRNTIGIAGRLNVPLAGAYPQTWTINDPHTGLAIGMRSFADLATGRRYLAGDVLMGASVFYNGRYGVRLINS